MNKLKQIAKRREELLESYPNLAKELTAIRENVVKNLPELLTKAEETLKGKGCQVYYAKTINDAQEVLGKLLEGQEQVVRAYSNTLSEIEFDAFLGKKNIKVNKTNINEILIKEAKQGVNGHPIFPNLGLSREEIIEALRKYLQTNTTDPRELKKLLHKKIKQEIIKSEFGITGINSIVAENGTIILAEDEGNGRAVSNLPYRHVVVAGIDKITNSVEEAMTTIQGATIYGLGRNNPTYYSLISGPSRTADIEFRMAYGMHGPKEVHVILLDNGRQRLIEQGCGELLKCIDCGACFVSIYKLAEDNSWAGVSFTAKGIALGIMQGKLLKLENLEEIEPFDCPVGIKEKSLGQILKKIEPHKII